MNILSFLFGGKAKSKPKPVVPPVVVPPVVVPPVVTPPSTTTAIKIEDWNDIVGGWLEMPVPFKSVFHLFVDDISGECSKTRVTVLSGTLTVTSAGVSGKHNPSIKPIKGVYTAGQSFVMECSLGPATSNREGGWDMVGFSVGTKELGYIIQLGAQVVYVH